jgi:coenzyme Q-binding protein COQ10
MTKFTVSRHVAYSADQVYAIASDVSSYRHFLPLMKKSDVFNAKDNPDGTREFEAELTISYKKLGISETMRSKVVANDAEKWVSATSRKDGPIDNLEAKWVIVPEAGGSSINLNIDYTLKSRSLQFLMSGMFDLMMRKIMTAFEERAAKLYGPKA